MSMEEWMEISRSRGSALRERLIGHPGYDAGRCTDVEDPGWGRIDDVVLALTGRNFPLKTLR